jgi:hypothetical protein
VPCDLVDDVSEAVFQWMRALAKGSGAADSFPAALVRACTAFLEALASADWEKFTASCSTISGCLVSFFAALINQSFVIQSNTS